MRVIGHEPPWEGSCDIENRLLTWTRGEELWDGSGFAWEMKDDPKPSVFQFLLKGLRPIYSSSASISWLEDEVFPTLVRRT